MQNSYVLNRVNIDNIFWKNKYKQLVNPGKGIWEFLKIPFLELFSEFGITPK